MTISGLIRMLEAAKSEYGDLKVEIVDDNGCFTDLNLVEVAKEDECPTSINIDRQKMKQKQIKDILAKHKH